MAWVHSQSDFEGVVYDNYRRYPFFSTRAQIIDDQFGGDYRNQITVVAGGGWGYLIDELDQRQWNHVYSLDASSYAVNKGGQELPTHASRILQGDVLNDQDLKDFRKDVGRPWFVVTEDLLPCAESQSEAQTMLTNLRNFVRPSGDILHIITPKMDDTTQISGMLWLTKQEWVDLIGSDEVIVFAGDYEVVNA